MGILCRKKNVDPEGKGERMRTGGALTTWTLMDMTVGVGWTGDQVAIEGYYKSKRINDTAFYIRTCSYEHINR